MLARWQLEDILQTRTHCYIIQSNFRIKDKMGTPVLSIVEKLSLPGNHHFSTVYLIFDCTKCIRLYELSENRT